MKFLEEQQPIIVWEHPIDNRQPPRRRGDRAIIHPNVDRKCLEGNVLTPHDERPPMSTSNRQEINSPNLPRIIGESTKTHVLLLKNDSITTIRKWQDILFHLCPHLFLNILSLADPISCKSTIARLCLMKSYMTEIVAKFVWRTMAHSARCRATISMSAHIPHKTTCYTEACSLLCYWTADNTSHSKFARMCGRYSFLDIWSLHVFSLKRCVKESLDKIHAVWYSILQISTDVFFLGRKHMHRFFIGILIKKSNQRVDETSFSSQTQGILFASEQIHGQFFTNEKSLK